MWILHGGVLRFRCGAILRRHFRAALTLDSNRHFLNLLECGVVLDGAVLAANKEDGRLTRGQVVHDIIARVGQVFDAAHVEPDAAKHPLALELEILRGDAGFRGHWPSAQVRILLGPPFVGNHGSHAVGLLALKSWFLSSPRSSYC